MPETDLSGSRPNLAVSLDAMIRGSLPRARSVLFVLSFLAVTVGTVAAFRMVAAEQPAPPPIGVSFTVYAGPHAERAPAVAFDHAARRHLIVWSDTTAGDIYGRVVDDQGIPRGPHFPISIAAGVQVSPTVAAGEPGEGFLVVWQDARDQDWDVYGQRVSAGGRLLSTSGEHGADPAANTPLITGAGDQYMPDVAYSSESERYLIVAVSDLLDGGVELVGRLVGTTGEPAGETITIFDGPRTVGYPAVTHNPAADEFLVVWQRQDVWLESRRLSASGEPAGQRQRIWGSVIQPYPMPIPDVVYNPTTGEYLVVWDDASDGDIYGVRVAASGELLSERLVVSSAGGRQVRPRVGVHDAGYLVAWVDRRTPDAGRVFGQFLSDAGALVNPQGTPGAPADTNVRLGGSAVREDGPGLAFNPGGVEYLLTWADESAADADVLAQRLWLPVMGPRPTPTPTFTPTATSTSTPTPTPTLTPTLTVTSTPRLTVQTYLALILRNEPAE